MTEHDISQLKNFSLNERDIKGREIFRDAFIISADLMMMTDDMVTFAKQQHPGAYCLVHDINLGKHSRGSCHYDGKAIDLHIEGMMLGHMARIAMRYFFGGIGLYPDWNTPGLHLDIRNAPCTWVQRDGKYIYTWPEFEDLLRAA